MNELMVPDEGIIFNTEVIKRGSFIRAKAVGWQEPRNGLISYVSKALIKALVFTGTGTAGTYLKISANDVNAGLWELKVSQDLEEVYYAGADSETTDEQP